MLLDARCWGKDWRSAGWPRRWGSAATQCASTPRYPSRFAVIEMDARGRAHSQVTGKYSPDLGLFCGQIQSYGALTSIAATLGVQYPALGDIHSGGTDETVIVCRTKRGQDALESTRQAGRIAMQEMTTDQVESCTIKGITGSKIVPAIARNSWLREKGRIALEFDYDCVSLLRGKLRLMSVLWIWKYRLTFWARTGWRLPFLLTHPWLLEKTGHFLYGFPWTVPGLRIVARFAKSILRILGLNR